MTIHICLHCIIYTDFYLMFTLLLFIYFSYNFRFYFKTESNELNTNMIYYEIIDDTEVIPRWKGLIWAKIEIDHNEVL